MQLEQIENVLSKHQATQKIVQSHYSQFQRLFLLRRLAECMLCAVFIYVGINFLIMSAFTLPLWPATGVALTMVFLRGNYPYAGILIGAIAAFYINCHLWTFSLLQGIGFTAYIYALRRFLLWRVGSIQPLSSLNVLLSFLLYSAMFTCIHVLLVWGVVYLYALPWPFDMTDFYCHWLAQWNGILCLTPFTLMFNPFTPKTYFKVNLKNSAWCASMLIIIFSHFLFIWVEKPIFALSLLSTLLAAITIFSYAFGQIPTACLLLGMGLLYLAGLNDLTSLSFNEHISHTYLGLVCIVSLIVSTYHASQGSKKMP